MKKLKAIKTRNISCRVSMELYDLAKQEADKLGLSINDYVLSKILPEEKIEIMKKLKSLEAESKKLRDTLYNTY